MSASTYTAPSAAAATASTILPLPGRGRSGDRVHRLPVRVNARAAGVLALITLAVITRNLLPVQAAETTPRYGTGTDAIRCHCPVAALQVTVAPVSGQTSMSLPPPQAVTGGWPIRRGGAAIFAQLFALGSYAAAPAGHGRNPGSTTTRARPSHTARGSQSRIGAGGILSHRPWASCCAEGPPTDLPGGAGGEEHPATVSSNAARIVFRMTSTPSMSPDACCG